MKFLKPTIVSLIIVLLASLLYVKIFEDTYPYEYDFTWTEHDQKIKINDNSFFILSYYKNKAEVIEIEKIVNEKCIWKIESYSDGNIIKDADLHIEVDDFIIKASGTKGKWIERRQISDGKIKLRILNENNK